MKDEEYLFRQDVKEKASTARSARSKRTHNGKAGRVKFPSDYMTRKELQAMNGEIKSYRLNEPMTRDEFKSLPDDIKIVYIKALRQKYGVSDAKIAQMLCFSQPSFSIIVRQLGIGVGRNCKNTSKFDKEGWIAWCNGAPVTVKDDETSVVQTTEETHDAEQQAASHEEVCDPVHEEKKNAIPCSGNLVFEGRVEDVLNSVAVILGGATVRISIKWNVLPEGEGGCEDA